MDNVGIDIHKRESQICILSETGELLVECRVKTSRDSFEEVFASKPKCRVLVEAAGESEWIARLLESFGHEVIVAHPGYEPMYAHRSRKVKTDKRDARVLAEALHKGIFRRAHRKSDEQRHRAGLLAVRDALVRTRAKLIVVAKALLRGRGLRPRTGSAERFTLFIDELTLDEHLREELSPLLAMLAPLNQQIEKADEQIERIAAADDRVARLQSVDGIGPVTSVAFLATIDEAGRFDSARQVPAYIGLVPSEYSSGEKQRRGRITKAGPSQLRSLLVQAALRIRRSRGAGIASLREWSEKIALRRGRKIAVVALARKLAMILYAILRDGALFHAPSSA